MYLVAGIIWGVPGIIITSKGIVAYGMQPSENLWWLLMITAAVMTAFYLMFRRIVDRYRRRIVSLPDIVSIWQTFPARGWFIIPGIPSAFTASFYTGLGPMLLLSSFRFLTYLEAYHRI